MASLQHYDEIILNDNVIQGLAVSSSPALFGLIYLYILNSAAGILVAFENKAERSGLFNLSFYLRVKYFLFYFAFSLYISNQL